VIQTLNTTAQTPSADSHRSQNIQHSGSNQQGVAAADNAQTKAGLSFVDLDVGLVAGNDGT